MRTMRSPSNRSVLYSAQAMKSLSSKEIQKVRSLRAISKERSFSLVSGSMITGPMRLAASGSSSCRKSVWKIGE